jgi:hypothetical protein
MLVNGTTCNCWADRAHTLAGNLSRRWKTLTTNLYYLVLVVPFLHVVLFCQM